MTRLRALLRRPSTQIGLGVGAALYAPLAAATDSWTNPALLALSVAALALAPRWAQLVNRTEGRVLLRWPFVTAGRLCRLLAQTAITGVAIGTLAAADILTAEDLGSIGGLIGAAALVGVASHGWQVFGIRLANRGRGYKNRNVLIALGAASLLMALIPRSNTAASIAFYALLAGGGVVAIADTLIGVLSDIRSVASPRGGIGIFLGTFNPVHKTHIEMIQRALRERELTTVLVHPTIVPKLHAQALARGEIEIVGFKDGMRTYARTARADQNVEYFPTGNRFYDHRTRALLFRLSLRDAGIEDRVEVLALEDVYAARGFYGVISEIKRAYPGHRLHGLHGSDAGGMWNRAIYDESGRIYPFAVVRDDGVSGTAIRDGARGMMTPTAEAVVDQLRHGVASFSAGGERFAVRDDVVMVEPHSHAPQPR